MRKITKRTTAIVAAVVIGVGALGATAWANGWFSGSGNTSVSTAAALPVSATLTTKTSLFPGATVAAGVTATNPNGYPVRVTGITVNTAADSFTGPAACTFANSKIQLNPGKTFVIPAKATTATSIPDVADLLSMGTDADVLCAGAGSPTTKPIGISVTFAGEVA